MKHPSYKKIAEHIDRDEIISKLVIGISPKDIHEWLQIKYTNVSENKFVISEKLIKSFQDNYLDIYLTIKDDFSKAKTSMVQGTSDDLELSIKGNKKYKDLVLQTVGKELDLKSAIQGLINVIETRMGQVFDKLQEDPDDMNARVDRVLIEYVNAFQGLLEKAHKIVNNGPDQIVQHNITVQHIDQHVAVFYEAVKEVLEQMDLESSMFFMEKFNQKMSKIQDPNNRIIKPIEERMEEVKIINETINKKVNEL